MVTLVEYDAQWRALPLPTARRYARVVGRGTAAVLFDEQLFEKISLPGVAETPFVRRWVAEGAHC
eukprot:5660034-Prymnesium_polylepis.1